VVSSPPATEETVAMSCEIESCKGIGGSYLKKLLYENIFYKNRSRLSKIVWHVEKNTLTSMKILVERFRLFTLGTAMTNAFKAQSRKVIPTRDRCYDFLNIFAEFFGEKIGVFDSKNKANSCKKLIITLVFEKNAIFFAENCLKSQKNVIITSTPGVDFMDQVRQECSAEIIKRHLFIQVQFITEFFFGRKCS
jgi:hypothetical protein